MELKRKQRKHPFLQFEIEALRVLLERTRWITWMWLLLGEILLAILFVIFWDWLGS